MSRRGSSADSSSSCAQTRLAIGVVDLLARAPRCAGAAGGWTGRRRTGAARVALRCGRGVHGYLRGVVLVPRPSHAAAPCDPRSAVGGSATGRRVAATGSAGRRLRPQRQPPTQRSDVIDADGRRALELRSDCARCVGLCCVAPAFAALVGLRVRQARGHAVPEPAGRLPLRHPHRAARARDVGLHRLRVLRRRAAGHAGAATAGAAGATNRRWPPTCSRTSGLRRACTSCSGT